MSLAAFRLLKARLPEVEIVFFGANELDPAPTFPFVQRGQLTQEELALLFSSSDVGVVFSLTNPSFVPLEMIACGCAVVEIASERWQGTLTDGRDVWLVEPTAEAVADGIVQLLENNAPRKRLIENGLRRTRAMSWENSARQVEAILFRSIE